MTKIMKTTVILFGIQKALIYQGKWVSQCEEELRNYANPEKKFQNKGQEQSGTENKGRKKTVGTNKEDHQRGKVILARIKKEIGTTIYMGGF